ncbi:hypothetical protein FTRO_0510030, partial [Fructobacillus tropaeoli]
QLIKNCGGSLITMSEVPEWKSQVNY